MEEKILFEIPIYSMSKEEFIRRWQEKKKKFFQEFSNHGHNEDDTRWYWERLHSPRYIWKYNQIIGYIVISVTRQDVNFNIFCSTDKIYYADSKQKHFIINWTTNGTRIYARDKSDEYIKNEVKIWLKSIEKEHLHSRRYVDYTVFNNIIDLINIKCIMESL